MKDDKMYGTITNHAMEKSTHMKQNLHYCEQEMVLGGCLYTPVLTMPHLTGEQRSSLESCDAIVIKRNAAFKETDILSPYSRDMESNVNTNADQYPNKDIENVLRNLKFTETLDSTQELLQST